RLPVVLPPIPRSRRVPYTTLFRSTLTVALAVTGALANVFSGGQVSVTGSTDPFVSITGGSHALATNSGAGMFTIGAGGSLALNIDRKGKRLNSSHQIISYAVFCWE